MLKEDDFEQIFSERIDRNKVQIIKKFFVFQPSNLSQQKSSPYRHPVLPASDRKHHKFPAGFLQQTRSSDEAPEEDDSPLPFRCKRAPSSELSSFLLGLTTRIEQQTEEMLRNKISKTSPDRRLRHDQILNNLLRIRKQETPISIHSNPISNINHSSDIRDNGLPQLEKRMSEGNKSSNLPILNKNKSEIIDDRKPTRQRSSHMSYTSDTKKPTKLSTMVNNRSILNTAKISSKLFKAPQQPIFAKGYLSYDKHASKLLADSKQTIALGAKFGNRLCALTANRYIVMDRSTLRVLLQRNANEQIEIASLTKIMTCYLCLLVCQKYEVVPSNVLVRVSDRAVDILGTSAELQAGDILSLYDLLFGLMLPSGNDASVAVAEAAGKIIQKYKKKPTKKSHYQTFIGHMNLLAKQIETEQKFQNSSGLSLNPNYSSPKAITVLTALAMLNPTFRQIISTKQYEVEIRNERFGLLRKAVWKNTNKLLWKGWEGVKTGTTETAGHCLMSCKGNYLISVFDCETLSKRFTECSKLYDIVSGLDK